MAEMVPGFRQEDKKKMQHTYTDAANDCARKRLWTMISDAEEAEL
jgi:hypothetical protein